MKYKYLIAIMKQINGKKDVLLEHLNSQRLTNIKIFDKKDCVELLTVIPMNEQDFRRLIDDIKVNIESVYGRMVMYSIKEIMLNI